jgi:hypothetical protein
LTFPADFTILIVAAPEASDPPPLAGESFIASFAPVARNLSRPREARDKMKNASQNGFTGTPVSSASAGRLSEGAPDGSGAPFKAEGNAHLGHYVLIPAFLILLILVVFSVLFHKIRKRLKKLSREKDRSEADLLSKLKAVKSEKNELERELEKSKTELSQNRKIIEILSAKLKKVTEEYDTLKSEYELNRIEELYSEIKELTDRNKALDTLLENTHEKIWESNRILGHLKNEVDSLKHPEVYIDFEKKVIRHKNGSEFIYSSAAKQYKNDVFRYLEYILRNRKRRIHLLEFGLNDPKFFLERAKQDRVREYNFEGKFAKVKSGINRTFRDNVGKELILHDNEKIYAYCTFPDTVLRITSKERDIDIILSEINRSKMPEILTFFGYETFDYYRINNEISMTSNIMDSAERFESALKTEDPESRRTKLEEALLLDEKNYPALDRLLEFPSFHFFETIQRVRANIRADMEILSNFLSENPIYRKRITNINKIKLEYRETYSWKFVNSTKSVRFKSLGEIAFRRVLEYEIKKMEKMLDGYKSHYAATDAYFQKFERLKSLFRHFEVVLDKHVIAETFMDFLDRMESAGLDGDFNADGKEIRTEFLRFFIERNDGNFDRPITDQTLASMVDYLKWLFDKGFCGKKNAQENLGAFFRDSATDGNLRKKVERLCYQLTDDLDVD